MNAVFTMALAAIGLMLVGKWAARRYEFNENFPGLCWGLLAIATFGIWIPIPLVRWIAAGVYVLSGSAFIVSAYLHTVNADEHRRHRQERLNRQTSGLVRALADSNIHSMDQAAKDLGHTP